MEPPLKRFKNDRSVDDSTKRNRSTTTHGITTLTREAVEAHYFVDDNGFRQVSPYVFEFQSFSKKRWIDCQIVDVFAVEFVGNTREHFHAAIECGIITVNGKKTSPYYRIKKGDLISHLIHRHESPVSGDAINIAFEDDEIVAVDKPANLPIHPCGGYRYNTLVCVLSQQRPDLPPLYGCHRLDKLTSGLVIFAKNKARVRNLCETIRSHKCKKIYLARVKGDFGADFPKNYEYRERSTDLSRMYWKEIGDVDSDEPSIKRYEVCAPIEAISHQTGQYHCDVSGKESITIMKKLKYDFDSDSSLVECVPVHGRTHQIRLHLQWLGHPIANDPYYGGTLFYNDETAKQKSEHAATLLLAYNIGINERLNSENVSEANSLQKISSMEKQSIEKMRSGTLTNESLNDFVIRCCCRCSENFSKSHPGDGTDCQLQTAVNSIGKNDMLLSLDSLNHSQVTSLQALMECNGIWLHSWHYQIDDWNIKTSLPKWALIQEMENHSFT